MSFITEIKTFAALGSGVIGSGWVARALAHGLDVVAWDRAGCRSGLAQTRGQCLGGAGEKRPGAGRFTGPPAFCDDH